jgi:acyl-CoA reductase-like NAD-dependent aldehyde dehydrogenase
LTEVPIWRAGRAQTSLDIRSLSSYRGETVARVHQAPALLVHRAVAELRRAAAAPGEDPSPLWPVIARAGELLADADIGGCSPDEHARLVTLATGAPYSDTRRSLHELAAALQGVAAALRSQAPAGDTAALSSHRVTHPDGKQYAWVPVGQVLGFIAPSNHPAVHLTWVLALAMGWSALLRPGADDPLTPWRLAQALAAAGFPMERLALLSGGHDLVPAIVAACDRTVAYGGPTLGALIDSDRRVLFNGPGHSKVLVDAPAKPLELVDFLVDCIAHDGGRKCTCASAIVVRGEAPGLLAALAERLAAVPLLDPLDPAAQVPAWKDPQAAARTPPGAVAVQGITFVPPGLQSCPSPITPPFGAEVPAPWATSVALPAGTDVMPVLRGSLAVTLVTADDRMKQSCLFDPTIRKVYCGRVPPWYTEPGAPHQGRLSEFLFTAKSHREVSAP